MSDKKYDEVSFSTDHLDLDKLKSLLPDSCSNIELFARGKRGVIFKAIYSDESALSCCDVDTSCSPKQLVVAVKVSLPNSDAQSTTMLEGKYLDKVNFFGIGPTVYDYTDDYVIMEFIEGELIGKWLQENNSKEENTAKKDESKVLDNILIQLEILDNAGINKFELTNPYKHIIVKENLDIVLIDFERARFSNKAKNISQFKEYIKKKFKFQE